MVGEVSHLGEHLETICVRILNVSSSRNSRVIGMEQGGGGAFFCSEHFSSIKKKYERVTPLKRRQYLTSHFSIK